MDKFAQRKKAQGMIDANAAADAAKLEKLRSQVNEYELLLQDMRKVNLKTAENVDKMRKAIQTGIEKLNDDKEPEDHIGLMLMMVSWISTNKPEALDDFLRLHLLTWSSHFLEEMEEATDHPFYKGLARITRLSLEGIQEDREIEVEYPRFYR